MNEQERITFLRDVYRESGEQLRNIANIRNMYRSFIIVAFAALLGLLGRDAPPPNTPPDTPRAIWWVLVGFSAIGLLLTFATWRYVETARKRQHYILRKFFTDSETDAILNPEDPICFLRWLRKIEWIWWYRLSYCIEGIGNKRLHFFEASVYVTGIIIGLLWAICGDPFTFTK